MYMYKLLFDTIKEHESTNRLENKYYKLLTLYIILKQHVSYFVKTMLNATNNVLISLRKPKTLQHNTNGNIMSNNYNETLS